MTDRSLSAATVTYLGEQNAISYNLIEFGFTVPMYYTDAPFDIDYGGDTYVSAPTLSGCPAVSETIDIKPNTISLKMPGVELATNALLVNNYKYTEVIIRRQIRATIHDTIELYRGYIDTFTSLENAKTGKAEITWKITNHWANWEHKNGRRITNDSQQAIFAGDDGLKFAGVTDPVSAFWGERAFMDFSHYVPPELVQQIYTPSYYDIWLWGVEHYWAKGTYDWEAGNAGEKSLPVAYGYCAITGTPVFRAVTGTNGEFLWVVYAICEGEIGGVGAIYLDGTEYRSSSISAFVSATVYTGTDTQAADAALVAAATDWTSACQLKGIAYVVMKYTYNSDKFAGEPTPRFIVQGKKCLDPRDASTDWQNGLNPALVLRDYLTNERYGKGLASALLGNINASADICDVTNNDHDAGLGGSPVAIEAYRFSGYLDTDKEIKKNVNAILFTMFGHIPWSAGIYNLRLESETLASAYLFDNDTIDGNITVSDAPIKSYANKLTYNFINYRDNYSKDSSTVESATFLAADNNIVINQTVNNPNETNPYRAENHAETLLKKSRNQKTISFTAANADALQVEVGDMVTLTRESKGWVAKEFRVNGMKIDKTNKIIFDLFEYEATVYNWTVSIETAIPNDSVLGTPYSVAPVTVLSLSSGTAFLLAGADGSITSRIFGDFTGAADAFVDHYDVLYKKSTETDYVLGTQVSAKDATEFFLTPVEDGVQYNVRLYAVNTLGVRSTALNLNHTVVGKTAVPSTPSALVEGSVSLNIVNLSWTGISDADFSHYEIFAYVLDDDKLATLIGSSKTNQFTHATEIDLYYWVRAVDTSGLVSPFSATAGVHGTPDGLTTTVEWADVLDGASTKPENNATLGATWDDNIDGVALPDSYTATDIIYHDWLDGLDRWGLMNAILEDGIKISGGGYAARFYGISGRLTWENRRFFSVNFVASGLSNHSTTIKSHFHLGGVPNGGNQAWGFAFARSTGSTMKVYFYMDDMDVTTYVDTGVTFTDSDYVRCAVFNNSGTGAFNYWSVIVNGTKTMGGALSLNMPTGSQAANAVPFFMTGGAAAGVVFLITDYYFHQYSS